MSVSLWAWAGLGGFVLLMLAVDLFAHRRDHEITAREAAAWSGLWVALGLAFGGLIWLGMGSEAAGQYYAGYLIEKSLAVDNVFVWALLFSFLAVPRKYQHRVLFYGVIGALVMRAILIAAGATAIKEYLWVLYLFGAMLVITGIGMLRKRNSHPDLSRSRTYQLFRRFVPMTDQYHGSKFLVRRDGALLATPLLLALVMVETTDLVFAVDSIPAIFAVTQEPFLVFSANAFAVLGLRAMYFLLADLMHRFVYLKAGLGLVLVWVGVKLVLQVDVYKIPTTLSLAVVGGIVATAIGLSLWTTRGRGADSVGSGAADAPAGDAVEGTAASPASPASPASTATPASKEVADVGTGS